MSAGPRTILSPRFLATSLLFGMGGLAVGTSLLSVKHLVADNLLFDMVKAGSRAGVVGGLADWFAVTALFRHPMGIPIPHTAILPRRKAQLGEALGNFVANQFFTDEDVSRVLARADVAKAASRTIAEPKTRQTLITALRGAIPSLCTRLEDGRARAAFSHALSVLMNGEDIVPLVVRALRAMVDDEMHQEVFSFFLEQIKTSVVAREHDLHSFIAERVREQGGRFLGWAIGSSVARRVLGALRMELERIDPMDSDLRHSFTRWVRAEIDLIETDSRRAGEIAQALASFFGHDSLKTWTNDLWARLRRMAEEDSRHEDGWSATVFDVLTQRMAESLENNENLRAKINQAMKEALLRLMPNVRSEVSGLIRSVVNAWDGEALAARLEAGVGRDLAYIRANGTVVGFLAGALLDGIFRLVLGG